MDDNLFDEEDEDTQKDKYLTFQLGKEVYGVAIRHVIEIVGLQRITEVPEMPDFVKGVINLRGQVIPVIDVRTRFRMPARQYDHRTCVIVVRMRHNTVGMVVDTVNEVADIPEADVAPPPSISAGPSSRYIWGMGKMGDQVRILLDVDRLLYDREMEALE